MTTLPKEVTLSIDGLAVTVPEGTLLVEAAKAVQTDIPVYCYHPKLGPAGLCRICLVEIEKTPKLQIACNTVVTEGMVVRTQGPKVEDGRRAVLEFLLLNHPLDCPICDKGGECDLQDYSIAYGQGMSRLAERKELKPKAIDLGPTIVLDDERCIVCQRCSRFDEIVTNERSLVVKDRGQRDVIATATGAPYRSNFSGNVTELCPVGALTSKTYRFRSRPWDLQRTRTTCQQCSVGCALNVDERHGNVLRTMSVPSDDAVSEGWLCDRGRYNVGFYADERRITSPLGRFGDEWVQLSWDDAIELWATRLEEALASAGSASIGVLGGGRLLNEEILLVRHVMRALGIANVDWRTGRQRQASPGARGGTYDDLENAQAIVTLGRPPSQSAPVMDLRIRKAVLRNGARLISIGAHPASSFVPATHLARLSDLAGTLAEVERIAFVWDGIDAALGAEAEAALAKLAAEGKHVSVFVPGETPNARGAEALGLLPAGGALDTQAQLEAARGGTLRILSIFGANPVLHHPAGAAFVREALKRVPFVVATDLFLTETGRLAHLVLPAKAAFEKDGHSFDLTGAVHAVNAAHGAPPDALSDGEVMIALAAHLGIDLPSPRELADWATASPATIANGLGDAALCGSLAPARDGAAGLRLAIAAHPFAGGGTVYFDDRLGELRPRPGLLLSPATAQAAGIGEADLVDLAAGGRVLHDLVATLDGNALEGVVTIVDGLPEAPANDFGEGETVTLGNVRSSRALAGSVV